MPQEVKDLTGSPEKSNPYANIKSDFQIALGTADEETLCTAIAQLCAQRPGRMKLFVPLLTPRASVKRPSSPAIGEESIKKQRKVRICDNCGGDLDDGDGCCKYGMIQEAK